MDAIELLKNDHRTVERLFSRYEDTTDQAEKTRDDLVDEMIQELSVHAVIEEAGVLSGGSARGAGRGGRRARGARGTPHRQVDAV